MAALLPHARLLIVLIHLLLTRNLVWLPAAERLESKIARIKVTL